MKIAQVPIGSVKRLTLTGLFAILGLAGYWLACADRDRVRSVPGLWVSRPVPVRIDWAMAERFGPHHDRDRDGRPDLPNSFEKFIDPNELTGFERLSLDAHREAITRDAELIFDVAARAQLGLAGPRNQLDRVAATITADPILARAAVYLLEYPDPTGGAVSTGRAMLDDLIPGLRVNRRELDVVRECLLRPLNRTLREAADRHHWRYVDEIFIAFQGHGYLAEDTWFRRAKESEQIQGRRLSPVGYLRGELAPGTLHPNHAGHLHIGNCLYRTIGKNEEIVHHASSH